MNASSELFELIKSLTKHEKIHIMQGLAAKGHDKKIIQLYTALDKQKEFDDEAVKKKIGHPKWYSNHKHYLYEWITNHLIQGTSEKKSQAFVFKQIMLSDILWSKGLKKQAKKKLTRAYDICIENEWLDLKQCIVQKLILIIASEDEQRTHYDFYLEQYKALDQYYYIRRYKFLFRLLEFTDRKDMQLQFLKQLNVEELLQNEKHLTTYPEKLSYYEFLIAYFTKSENYIKNYFYTKKYLKSVKLYLTKSYKDSFPPDKIKKVLEYNIVGSINAILGAFRVNAVADIDKLFSDYLLLENKVAFDKGLMNLYNRYKYRVYFIMVAMKITRWGIESADFGVMFGQFQLMKKKTSSATYILCNDQISFHFFMKNKWNECTAAINNVLNDRSAYKLYKSSYGDMLMLQLFVNYETNDIDILEYNLKKTERYFAEHTQPLQYEKIILEFFNEVINAADKAGKRKIIIEFRDKFNKLKKVVKNLTSPYYSVKTFIDFECWLESKIEHKPLVSIVKTKALKNKS
jgi:hypothetical protein